MEEWGCKRGGFPDLYLGLPLGAKIRRVAVWEPLLRKFRKRLALWRERYLRKGGCLTSINSSLASLLVYLMSTCLIPSTVGFEIEKLIRRVLLGTTV